MALGGRGVISVVSNEIPGRDDAARAGLPARRFRNRRAQIQRRYLPLMNINFVESNPDPGEGRDGR